jgi:hypothetical protein
MLYHVAGFYVRDDPTIAFMISEISVFAAHILTLGIA